MHSNSLAQGALAYHAARRRQASAVLQQAMTLSFNDLYSMFSGMFIFLIPWVWFAKPPFTMRATGGGH
jgi:hypothetical protein